MGNQRNHTALGDLSALVDFSKFINSSLELEFTLNNLLLTCLSKFHITRGVIMLHYDNGLKIYASKGIPAEQQKNFALPVFDNYSDDPIFRDFIERNKLPHIKEIHSYNEKRGLILLGEKLTKLKLTSEEEEFLDTLINIASTAIENSMIVEKLRNLNRDLDAKVNQLSSLFDLSKEFSGILEIERVVKLLVFSIIGQMLVSKYAVLAVDNSTYRILETKINREKLTQALDPVDMQTVQQPLSGKEIQEKFPALYDAGLKLIIPMKIKSEIKGLILLGGRVSGRNYSRSDIEYLNSVGSLAIISMENGRLFQETLEKQRMVKDLELARDIQRNLLPGKFPKSSMLEIAAINRSARQVGGDYYDVLQPDPGRTLLAIADVSGKGVQAALLMANLQAFLKSISKQDIPINEATGMINDLVSENTSGGSFITFFWMIVDEKTGRASFVNAGHNPPILFRNGEIIRLKKGGIILGLMETMIPYEKDELQLKSGDLLVLFTDGVSEAMDINGEEYGEEQLMELLPGLAELPAEEIKDKIIDNLESFTSGAAQSDDITLVAVKVK